MLNVPYQQVSIEKTQNWTHTEYDYISTNKGQWFAIDVRLGINMDIVFGFRFGRRGIKPKKHEYKIKKHSLVSRIGNGNKKHQQRF